MMVSNRNLFFQGSIFRFHVCFGGCICRQRCGSIEAIGVIGMLHGGEAQRFRNWEVLRSDRNIGIAWCGESVGKKSKVGVGRQANIARNLWWEAEPKKKKKVNQQPAEPLGFGFSHYTFVYCNCMVSLYVPALEKRLLYFWFIHQTTNCKVLEIHDSYILSTSTIPQKIKHLPSSSIIFWKVRSEAA